MGALLNRRRYMGGGSADEIIMTSESNPSVMAICFAKGWASHADYMTKKEAEAVTSIGTAFQSNTSVTHFDEFQYFTNVTALVNNAFNGCTALSSLILPPSVTSINSTCFVGCPFEDLDLSSITTISSASFNNVGLIYPWLPSVTRTGSSSWNTAAFHNCSKLVGIRFDAITYLGALVYASSARYMVVTTASVPTGVNPSRWPATVYVRDELVTQYQGATNWSTKTIKGLSSLPEDDPDCPWISDLRDKGMIL